MYSGSVLTSRFTGLGASSRSGSELLEVVLGTGVIGTTWIGDEALGYGSLNTSTDCGDRSSCCCSTSCCLFSSPFASSRELARFISDFALETPFLTGGFGAA